MSAKWLILVLTYLCIAQGQSPCTTPDGKRGNCKRINACEALHKLVQEGVLVQMETLNLLRQSKCGFEQDTGKVKVCCPPGCETRQNHTVAGQCVNINDCDHIKNRLAAPPVPQEYRDYVNGLRCGGDTSFSVCCGPPPTSEPVSTTTPTRALPTPVPENRAPPVPENRAPPVPGNSAPPVPENRAPSPVHANIASLVPGNSANCMMSAQPPDPASGCCGSGAPTNKINGGEEAGLGQYPWLALIEYEQDYTIKLLCGGVLISGRYVLTAGHCVVGAVILRNVPKNVRLGEHNTATDSDCELPDGGDEGDEECSLDPVIIPIDQIISHPEYNPRNPLKRNDIAMLRLASIPAYTKFVQPICLPTVDITTNFPEEERLYAAGWGAVTSKIPFSNVKLHVKLPYKTFEVCQQAFSVPQHRIQLWDHQVCAGGELGKDACKGDSGGPLMYYVKMNNTMSIKSHYELIGIVSFGLSPCGVVNVPGVYTKVIKYIPWIHSVIRP